jgi:hypothetical protein
MTEPLLTALVATVVLIVSLTRKPFIRKPVPVRKDPTSLRVKADLR